MFSEDFLEIINKTEKAYNPQNCNKDNLKAYCAPCHLRYDAQHHAETRKKKKEGN